MDQKPHIIWDQGSAYDLFVSLWIIHRPDEFGLRPSWAAGVRSRLPSPQRETLEEAQNFLKIPMRWVHSLPEPKDAQTALDALGAIPVEERLATLMFTGRDDEKGVAFHNFLKSLAGKQRLTAKIEDRIQQEYPPMGKKIKTLARAMFNAWTDPAAFGAAFYDALAAYVQNFYQEEEERIRPAQQTALASIQARLEKEDLLTVLEDVSGGVRMDWVEDVEQLVLAPSFWGAPFVFFDSRNPATSLILFGARPKGMALVPGELVPEELLNALKALADPTRLRILRTLLEAPSTPSDLAKSLRLRPPTVIHHLHILRLAGLVHVTIAPKTERRYAIRQEGLDSTIGNIQDFLSGE
jgi:DNA-binding transcriptional ArsR family regulator